LAGFAPCQEPSIRSNGRRNRIPIAAIVSHCRNPLHQFDNLPDHHSGNVTQGV
jgi:hypothetical protein